MATLNVNKKSEYETFASFLNPIPNEIPSVLKIKMSPVKKSQRDGLHEYEGFQIKEYFYCVLFSVERIEDDFDIELKEIARAHLLRDDEYKVMETVEHDLFVRIENICYDFFDRTMPEDFFDDDDSPSCDDSRDIDF